MDSGKGASPVASLGYQHREGDAGVVVLSSSNTSMMSRGSYGEALSPSMLNVSRGGREMTPEEALREENRRLLQVLIKTQEKVGIHALGAAEAHGVAAVVRVRERRR